MSNTNVLAKGGAINFTGAILFQVLNFIFLLFLTHSLGAEKTGFFILGLTTVTILGTVALLGLNKGVIRHINTRKQTEHSNQEHINGIIRFSTIVITIFGLLLTVFLIFSSKYISTAIFNSPELDPILLIMSFSIPLYGLTLMFGAVSRAYKIMNYTVIVEQIFRPSLQLIFSVVILVLGYELFGLSLAYVLALLFSMVLAYFFMRRVVPNYKTTNLTTFDKKALLKFSIPASLTNLLTYAMVQTEVLLLGILSSAEDVSLYYVAWRVAAFGVIFHGALAGIFTPYVSSLLHENNSIELDKLYKLVTRWGITICLPILCILALFSQPIMGLFGSEYATGYLSLVIIALGLIINISVGPSGVALVMSGHSMLDLYNNLALLVIKVFFALLLIPEYGLVGAALSSVLASSTINLIRVWQVTKLVKINPFTCSLAKPFIAALISSISTLVLIYILPIDDSITLFIFYSLLFLIIYTAFMFLFKLEAEDKIIKDKIIKYLQLKTNPLS